MICLHMCILQQVGCQNISPLFMFQVLQKKKKKMRPGAKRWTGPLASSCSFRVKFSQTLDFLLQTSHSNTLASPPRFFPQVHVINSAVCSVDWPSSSQSECLCPPLLSHSPFHSSRCPFLSEHTNTLQSDLLAFYFRVFLEKLFAGVFFFFLLSC